MQSLQNQHVCAEETLHDISGKAFLSKYLSLSQLLLAKHYIDQILGFHGMKRLENFTTVFTLMRLPFLIKEVWHDYCPPLVKTPLGIEHVM